VDVELTQSMPEFCVSSQSTETGYFVDLEEVNLYVRRQSIHPNLSRKIQQEFNRGPAYYPFIKNEIKITHIPKGMTTFVSESMFRGILPAPEIFGEKVNRISFYSVFPRPGRTTFFTGIFSREKN